MSRIVSSTPLAVLWGLVALSGIAEAQVGRRPAALQDWVAGGVSVNQGFTIRDGATNSQWTFDSGLGYWAAIEHPTQTGIIIGVQAGHSTPTMLYTTNSAAGAVDCTAGCAAKGNLRQIMGLLKTANSYGTHPVIEVTAGATAFSNFKQQTTNTQLGSAKTDYDFSFALGYGLSYSVSTTAAFEVMQEIGTIMHSTTDLPVGSRNYPRVQTTRVGARVVF